MRDAERKNVEDAVRSAVEQARKDLFSMGKGTSKRLRKAANKARIQDFQNNAFNKKVKK